jgi:hypothetical protein
VLRNASLIVCEDLRFESTGKFMLVGGISGDITIDPAGGPINRLIFLFQVEYEAADTPKRVSFEVKLPGYAPHTEDKILSDTGAGMRTILISRNTMTFNQVPPVAGTISARIVSGGQVIDLAAPWIVTSQPPR